MSKREEILAVLLVMCAMGWALEHHHSQSKLKLAATIQNEWGSSMRTLPTNPMNKDLTP